MRKKVKFILKFFIALLLFIQTSCAESRQAVSTSAEQNSTGKLLFINLRFWKTTEGRDSCEVINTILAEGTLKDENHDRARNKENYYTVFLSSCKGKTLYKEEIDNQLDTQMEVYNENGSIELKNTSFKQREYSIRVQMGKEKICRVIVTKNEKGQVKTLGNHLL